MACLQKSFFIHLIRFPKALVSFHVKLSCSFCNYPSPSSSNMLRVSCKVSKSNLSVCSILFTPVEFIHIFITLEGGLSLGSCTLKHEGEGGGWWDAWSTREIISRLGRKECLMFVSKLGSRLFSVLDRLIGGIYIETSDPWVYSLPQTLQPALISVPAPPRGPEWYQTQSVWSNPSPQ